MRDYAILFAQLAKQRVELQVQRDALTTAVAGYKAAQENALKVIALRQNEKRDLGADFQHMQADRSAIESLLKTIQKQVANAGQLLETAIKYNAELARQLTQRQTGMLGAIPLGLAAPAVQ